MLQTIRQSLDDVPFAVGHLVAAPRSSFSLLPRNDATNAAPAQVAQSMKQTVKPPRTPHADFEESQEAMWEDVPAEVARRRLDFPLVGRRSTDSSTAARNHLHE